MDPVTQTEKFINKGFLNMFEKNDTGVYVSLNYTSQKRILVAGPQFFGSQLCYLGI